MLLSKNAFSQVSKYSSSVVNQFSTSAVATAPKPRHLVSMLELSSEELANLVSKAGAFKAQVRSGEPTPVEQHQKLLGKLAALVFSKRSTRTRISTEGAVSYFGGQPMFLGKDDIQLGVNESFYDTTRVVSSMTSCIFARVDKHSEIQELCAHSSVPIINSLCDKYHPLQAIADILTIKEAFGGETQGLKLAWIGDSNNVINDLAIACVKSGINVSISIPKGIEFDPEIAAKAAEIANENLGTFEIVNDPQDALPGADIIVTDTWISMGEEAQKEAKLKQFAGYQIDQKMIANGKASANWKFMHCLPRHQEEVADDVFYDESRSLVFEEAENRLYAAMAAIEGFVNNKGDLLK
ncbi:ornithine carbamoyltransferase [[Candida] railenensis]|uniref:ornithine carbamoyltransferase n=1 Tax=[Candida] railenensis TaxID=45579 RepID=A0A9P0QS71_9ASCO|nr:ornithine carbamoyltransferase [[Candida] railenensis]